MQLKSTALLSSLQALQALLSGSFWPILLKKSAVFSKAEKYASEIEILNVRRAFQAEISRRSVLKRRFHRSILRDSEKTDFFNRIGRFVPLETGRQRPEADGRMRLGNQGRFSQRIHPHSK